MFNVLIVCSWGKNRSVYLASYLGQKGYPVKYGGIYTESDNQITQELVDWANIVIFVQPQTKRDFEEQFRINKQKVIILDVEDRIAVLAPEKENITPEEWTKIQQEKVYPELEKQIDKHLPFT
ncbi:MAG: hypothetical protein ABII24_02180 [bacterium]